MTDLRTPENFLPDEILGDADLVPADDAIIGRAFRWSLLLMIFIAAVLAAMVLLLQRGPAPVVVLPRDFVPPRRLETSAQPPPILFTDITADAGIDFVHSHGATGDKLLPETMGGGAAFLDIENDGDQDLLLINSCAWHQTELPANIISATTSPSPSTTLAPSPHSLYQNNGDSTFTNITTASGLDAVFYGMGCAVGDYDNDGFTDFFISAVGPNHLYRNLGDGRFEDVTARAKVSGAPGAWSTSAGFIDIENDGDLDLFVCNYVQWSREIDFAVNYTLTGVGRAYGPPNNFEGAQSYLYRNNGDGTFEDISEAAGIHVNSIEGRPMGKALGLAPFDVDDDGLIDLFVANDTVRRFFFHNRGTGRFEEIGSENGLAFDRAGNATGAMGVDAAHYRNDRTIGFAIGNFANEMSSLMVSRDAAGTSSRQFVDEAITEGIGAPTRLKLKFGTFFFDADLDGRLDLLHANGHIEDQIHRTEASQTYAQSAQLFWNAGPDATACFVEAPPATVGDLSKPIVGRGAAYADIDSDGDLDVLLTQIGGRPMLLRNETFTRSEAMAQAASSAPVDTGSDHPTESAGGARPASSRSQPHWVRLKLVGNGSSVNRDAIGAKVELTAGDITQTRIVMPTRSYLSQVELPLTFGLGEASTIDSITITWPDGTKMTEADLPRPIRVNELLVISQKS